jgi:hypothetical protein
MPPQFAPWHLRLDWLMWFLPFSVMVTERTLMVPGYEVWFVGLMQKLLEDDRATLKLLRRNPFDNRQPRFIRALFYQYRYTTWQEKRETGAWWTRRLVGTYLSPISRSQIRNF